MKNSITKALLFVIALSTSIMAVQLIPISRKAYLFNLCRDYNASWNTQFSESCKRTLLQYKREPVLTRARMGNALAIGTLIGIVYFGQDNSADAVQNKLGVAFIMTINQSLSSMFGSTKISSLSSCLNGHISTCPLPRIFLASLPLSSKNLTNAHSRAAERSRQ